MINILTGVFIIIFILIWILIKILNTEDSNYSALKKLFFFVKSENINSQYLSNNNNVFGLLIEFNLRGGGKILFTSYITGFAGYYRNRFGGIIGGKYYPENDRGVQLELMELCEKKLLTGEFQTKNTRNLATRLTLKANDFLIDTVPSGTEISGNPNATNFWFLTKGGVYSAEVKKIKSNNCKWTELVNEADNIINKLEVDDIKNNLKKDRIEHN